MPRNVAWITNALAGISGAAVTCQFPAYYAQYLQSLGGRLDQAQIQAGRLRDVAQKLGLSVMNYVELLKANQDPVVQFSGRLQAEILADETKLTAAYQALSGATIWERPFVLMARFDGAIGQASAARFQPGFPLTLEGFAYALPGLLLGLGLVAVLRLSLRRLRKRTEGKPA